MISVMRISPCTAFTPIPKRLAMNASQAVAVIKAPSRSFAVYGLVAKKLGRCQPYWPQAISFAIRDLRCRRPAEGPPPGFPFAICHLRSEMPQGSLAAPPPDRVESPANNFRGSCRYLRDH